MRIALLIVVLALAACGKKKSPQAPAATGSQLNQDANEKDVNAPAEGEDANETRSSDPQEGGE
jgi:hypothetical protein